MTAFEKNAVWSTTAATAVTGIGLWVTKYMAESSDPWAVINHPLQPWFLKIHILVAPLMIFAVGMITMRHIWAHLKSGLPRARKSGLSALYIGVPMVVSGYLIQTVTQTGLLTALAYVHIVTGLAFCVGFALHQVAATRRTKRDRREAGERRRRTRRRDGRRWTTDPNAGARGRMPLATDRLAEQPDPRV